MRSLLFSYPSSPTKKHHKPKKEPSEDFSSSGGVALPDADLDADGIPFTRHEPNDSIISIRRRSNSVGKMDSNKVISSKERRKRAEAKGEGSSRLNSSDPKIVQKKTKSPTDSPRGSSGRHKEDKRKEEKKKPSRSTGSSDHGSSKSVSKKTKSKGSSRKSSGAEEAQPKSVEQSTTQIEPKKSKGRLMSCPIE